MTVWGFVWSDFGDTLSKYYWEIELCLKVEKSDSCFQVGKADTMREWYRSEVAEGHTEREYTESVFRWSLTPDSVKEPDRTSSVCLDVERELVLQSLHGVRSQHRDAPAWSAGSFSAEGWLLPRMEFIPVFCFWVSNCSLFILVCSENLAKPDQVSHVIKLSPSTLCPIPTYLLLLSLLTDNWFLLKRERKC